MPIDNGPYRPTGPTALKPLAKASSRCVVVSLAKRGRLDAYFADKEGKPLQGMQFRPSAKEMAALTG